VLAGSPPTESAPTITGVDLSKILGGQNKILGAKGGKSDKCMCFSQLLGDAPWLPPKSTPMPTITA